MLEWRTEYWKGILGHEILEKIAGIRNEVTKLLFENITLVEVLE